MTATQGRLAEVRTNSPREVATRRANVDSRRADLELARARLRQAELDLGYAHVRTPVAGIVARKASTSGITSPSGSRWWWWPRSIASG